MARGRGLFIVPIPHYPHYADIGARFLDYDEDEREFDGVETTEDPGEDALPLPPPEDLEDDHEHQPEPIMNTAPETIMNNDTEPIMNNDTVPIMNDTGPIMNSDTEPIMNDTEPIMNNDTEPIMNDTEPIMNTAPDTIMSSTPETEFVAMAIEPSDDKESGPPLVLVPGQIPWHLRAEPLPAPAPAPASAPTPMAGDRWRRSSRSRSRSRSGQIPRHRWPSRDHDPSDPRGWLA